MTDEQMISGLLDKDPLALEAFYKRYRALMYSTAAKYLREDWEIEEAVQDTVWLVWRKIDSFRGDSGLSTWVYRVAQNAARMLLRSQRRVPLPTEQDSIDRMLEHARQGEMMHLPEAQFQAEEVARQINTVLLNLPPENRELFVSMDVRGESKEEVAERLGMTISALKARLHRVRKTIRAAAATEASIAPAM
ncbi:MAG TPA: hypothetical protein DCQ06_07970 [Myxococcales bacterium]|nr:hypothetical protein [Myxococcales bacterium]HAN31520.1 hypothetical protein [Myxococcales bacterium]